MKKSMLPLTVSTDEETIYINQPSAYEDDTYIAVSIDQLDTLITWLQEAKSEIKKTED